MEIRSVQASENKEVAKVLRSVLIEMGVPQKGTAYEDPELDAMYETYQQPRAVYYLIIESEQILGGAGIAPLKGGNPSVCELQKMYFSPKARGKGYGYQMIQKCLAFAKEHEFDLCYIETMPNMEAAQLLYKRVGFDYIENPMGNTGHTSCPIWMTKSLV